MRTGRDECENLCLPFIIQKAILETCCVFGFFCSFINHCFCKLAPEGAQTVQRSDN